MGHPGHHRSPGAGSAAATSPVQFVLRRFFPFGLYALAFVLLLNYLLFFPSPSSRAQLPPAPAIPLPDGVSVDVSELDSRSIGIAAQRKEQIIKSEKIVEKKTKGDVITSQQVELQPKPLKDDVQNTVFKKELQHAGDVITTQGGQLQSKPLQDDIQTTVPKKELQRTGDPNPISEVVTSATGTNEVETTATDETVAGKRCDYGDGRWVRHTGKPAYDGSSCKFIKDSQNCLVHGRPDTDYLHWRWRPWRCRLPAFDSVEFLRLARGKRVAIVGDSLARNQAESLVCLLSSVSPVELVDEHGSDEHGYHKFRRWAFPEHGVNVSLVWSPFLVRAIEKLESAGIRHSTLFLDSFDERWAAEAAATDVIVFSIGHWFLLPSIYREGTKTIGCHHCPEFNFTDVGFFGAFRTAVRRAVEEVGRRHAVSEWTAREKVVAVTTFSPAHFEGKWDANGVCPRTTPFGEGEKEVGYTEAELRKAVVEEVTMAAARGGRIRYEVLDVTMLAMMRPDGHPGPYMHKDYAAKATAGNVTAATVQNDCVHWCLPGPVDTFNEILLQLIKQ